MWNTCAQLDCTIAGERGGHAGSGLSEEAAEQAGEAWGLLRVAVGLRLPNELTRALQPLLASDLYARLVGTLEV